MNHVSMHRSHGGRHPTVAIEIGATLLLSAALLFGCGGGSGVPPPPPPGAIAAGQSIGTGGVSGRVLFKGTPPPRRAISMSGEAACRKPGGETYTEELIVNGDGTLRNVYIRVSSGLGDRVFAPPAVPGVVDQQGCTFTPHLLAVQTDQVIEFRNSDPVVHNVHALSTLNRTFNLSLSARGQVLKRYFSTPDVVKIRCDIHVWMSAYVAVGANPFQMVTGEDGAFALDGLPAGTYEIEAWHETLGTARQTVTLADGERGAIEFSFARP
jgi:plastocyanin